MSLRTNIPKSWALIETKLPSLLNARKYTQATQAQSYSPLTGEEEAKKTKLFKMKGLERSSLISFRHMEDAIKREIERYSKEKRFLLCTLSRFSRILNGLRPGELTIFTGPTGCGKTTVLSQMSLDYASQGVRVLWGSFEIRNTRLAQIMLQQVLTKPLVDPESGHLIPEHYQDASERLKLLPVSFMNLFGSTGLDTVLDTIEASLAPGHFQPHLVILDNLQFMLSGQSTNSLDKWELMDRAIASLRDLCNAYPIHLMLVVHPRKEMDDTPLGLASVSGTAKATQEADNVIILQKLGENRFLEVKKNRFFGDLGRVEIGYIPDSRMVFEINSDSSEGLSTALSSPDQSDVQ